MVCSNNPAEILADFKGQYFYVWFQHIPDDFILSVINSMLNCPPSGQIYKYCPKIFCCWFVYELAVTLNALGMSFDDQGNPVPPPIDEGPFVSYVKKDMVRDESREYFEPKKDPCKDCGDFPLGVLKLSAKKYADMCRLSQSLLGGYGSNYGCRKPPDCGCEKDSYH